MNTTIGCDANKLPEEIRDKAREYVAKRKPRFRTFGIVSDDVECAWLNGFAFCLEGQVKVKVKRCAACVYTDSHCTPSDYIKGAEDECPHYKDVFSAYADLKADYAMLSCSVDDFGELQNKLEEEQRKNNGLEDQLPKAKELIRTLLLIADNKVSQMVFQLCIADAKQFIKDSEV